MTGKIVVAILGLVLTLSPNHAQNQGKSGELEIKRLETELDAALLKADSATLDRILADDYIEIDARGNVKRKADVIAVARARSAMPRGVSLGPDKTVDELTIRLYKDSALVVGRTTIRYQFMENQTLSPQPQSQNPVTVDQERFISVIIYNNAANVNAAPPGMADDGINGVFVTIPTVSMTRADGLAVLGQVPTPTTAKLSVDLSVRAGADPAGHARLYAPFPVAPGSSISHWDTVAFRNLLMEPAINGDLTHNVKAPDDLTLELLRDVGWFADADLDGVPDNFDCEPNSNFAPTVVIGGCDSGVTNFLFTSGCTLSDLIAHIAANSSNHGQFVSGVADLTNQLKKAGLITGAQKGSIQSCAAGASIP